jgi:ABC-2 type transport system ATP-binding protein
MPAISFQSVSKTYPSIRSHNGPAVQALDDVSFDIQQGEFFGLLGPNGAGKTSLISILAGLSRASKGTVRVHGCDVVTDFANARRKLGVVPQELVFDPFFTVREALRIQSGYFGIKKNDAWIDELLASLGLTDKANANMRQLSGGMKRRVLVAQALVHKPQVIVLNRQGSTVLLTTHYLEEAEALCSRLAMLKQGRVVALAQTSDLLKAASSNVLRFKIDSALPFELASQARITGRIVQFPAHNAHEIEQYLAAVRQAGLVAEDVEIRKADLEDVFLEVMAEKVGVPA